MRKTILISCVALFFSLAGTGIAASHYLITNVSQIKPTVRALLTPKVNYVSSEASYCAGSCAAALATSYCPLGTTAIGGTAAASTPGTPVHTFIAPSYYVAVADDQSGAAGTLRVTAICAAPAISGTGSQIAKRDYLVMDEATRLAQALSAH